MGWLGDIGDTLTGNIFDFNGQGGGLKGWAGDIVGSHTAGSTRGKKVLGLWNPPGLNSKNPYADLVQPQIPEWSTYLDENGNIPDQYKLTDQMDMRAIDSLRGEALRDPSQQSAWAALANQELNSQENRAQDSLQAQVEAMKANRLNTLASHGGYDRGSMERLGRQSFRDMLRQKQNNRAEFGQKRLDVSKQDETNRLNSLNNMAGLDQSRANYLTGLDRANKGGALGEFENKRNFEMDRYQSQLKQWASERNARATEQAARASKPKSKFLGLF